MLCHYNKLSLSIAAIARMLCVMGIFLFFSQAAIEPASAAVINGACGPANWSFSGTAPATGLCSAGTPTAVSVSYGGTNPDSQWLWGCNGIDGGVNLPVGSCSAFVLLPAQLSDSTVATDWLAKDVCVDAANVPVPADPYYVCPPFTTLRKIELGDPLPYSNIDQQSAQYNDAFPILDAYGNTLYMHTFEYSPIAEFHLYAGSDGYDYYSVDSKWVSSPGTRDGGGYGQEFYGANCAPGDGWIYFPTTGFLGGGSATLPISGRYWEQSLMSYPGACPTVYGNPPTTWALRTTTFGGLNGTPVKTMDAMVVYHGYNPSGAGHMEIFWFTQQYGLTMWQGWVSTSQNPTKTTDCIVPDQISYGGLTYVVSSCRDWSNAKLATTSKIPQWPLPPANLLQHSHFDDGGGYSSTADGSYYLWHRAGNSAQGDIINWSLENSTAAQDTAYGPGVRFLGTNCAGTCTGAGVQEIYQGIPISAFVNNGGYLFGIDARTQSGTGTLQVTVQELGSGRVLWQDSVQGTVTEDNSTGINNEINSVYLSSAFIANLTTIPVVTGATKVRFYITPLTSSVTFEILDSWLNRFPIMQSQLDFMPDGDFLQ
jgi:hypothetical protein